MDGTYKCCPKFFYQLYTLLLKSNLLTLVVMRQLILANRRGIEINNSLKWVNNSGTQMGYGVLFIFAQMG